MKLLRRGPKAADQPIVRSVEALLQDEPDRFTRIFDPEVVRRRPPRHVDGEVHEVLQRVETYDQRGAFFARIARARVVGFETIVLLEDHRALLETAFDEYQLVRNRAYLKRLPAPVELAGPHILLSNQWARAHFHWFTDTLPRLSLVPDDARATVPVLVPPDISAAGRESLRMLGIADERVVVLPSEHVLVEELLLPSFTAGTGNPRRATLDWLRAHLLPEGAGPATRRVFVSRADAASRRVVNEDELALALAPLGFERVVMSELSLTDQLRTFAEAAVIVAPHGGGLTSLLAARDATVVELFGSDYVNGCYYATADALGLPYWYLVGEPAGNADFRIEPDRLLDTLRAAGVAG